MRILASKNIQVVELPSLLCHNTSVICEGGPRTLESGKLNIDWNLNQKSILTLKQATQLNITAKAKDADVVITLLSTPEINNSSSVAPKA